MSGSLGEYLTKCHKFLYRSLWLHVPWADTLIRDTQVLITWSHFVSPTKSQAPHDCSLTHVFLIGIFRFSSDNAFAWMPLGLIHDKSSLLQEWLGTIIQQAVTSRYYLSQCWPRSMPPHGVTQQDELLSNAWPQSVNIFEADKNMVVALQTPCWNTFSWKRYYFPLKFH